MKIFLFILFYFYFIGLSLSYSQNNINKAMFYKKLIDNKDTIYVVEFPTVNIFGKRIFKNAEEALKYSKLMRDVKKVYPYAKIAAFKLKIYNQDIENLSSKKEKKEYLKKAEQELKNEYEPIIRNMTFTQGKILIKLIDRETNKTSFEIIKELKGTFSAWFWQIVAKVFGANLKMTYDAQNEDIMIEQIINQIETGNI